MKKIFLLLTCILLIHQLYAVDGRAVRSNWECMDSSNACVSTDSNNSIEFSISLLFRPNVVSSLNEPLFLYINIEGDIQQTQLTVQDINNGIPETRLTGYNSYGNSIVEPVLRLEQKFIFPLPEGTTSFAYNFSLRTTNNLPFPIGNYPGWMAKFDPELAWTDYDVDTFDEIEETGTKPICTEECLPAACCTVIPTLQVDQISCEKVKICINGYSCADTWFKFLAVNSNTNENLTNGGNFTADNCYTFTSIKNSASYNYTVSVGLPDKCYHDHNDLSEHYSISYRISGDCSQTLNKPEPPPSGPTKVEIRPNPADDYTKLTIEMSQKAPVQIVLLDSSGNTVRSYNKQMSSGSNEIRISNLSQLQSGVYYYRVYAKNEIVSGTLQIR